jgi:glycerophosphoryl diester phosphodiesterase
MPDVKVGLLVEHSPAGRLLASRAFAFTSPHFIHPQTDFITAEYIQHEHEHGRKVNIWTVNDMQEAAKFRDWGIDGMIGDDPKGLIAV